MYYRNKAKNAIDHSRKLNPLIEHTLSKIFCVFVGNTPSNMVLSLHYMKSCFRFTNT